MKNDIVGILFFNPEVVRKLARRVGCDSSIAHGVVTMFVVPKHNTFGNVPALPFSRTRRLVTTYRGDPGKTRTRGKMGNRRILKNID